MRERRGATARLDEESAETLRLVLDASAAGTWIAEPGSSRLRLDRRAHQLFGYDVPRRVRRWTDALERLHPADRAAVEADAADFLAPGTRLVWDRTFRVTPPGGGTLWLHTIGRARRDRDGRVRRVMGIVLDVTAARETEIALRATNSALQAQARELEMRTRQLRRLASELTLAEQRTREQIAKTLHDHVQQLLFSSSMAANRLVGRLDGHDPELRDLAGRVREELDEALAAARSLAVELFPPVLRQAGLPAALAWLAEWMQRRHGLRVTLDMAPGCDLDRYDVRMLLFESVRELLFNVVKHARVDRVDLTMQRDATGRLLITVTDRGVGLATQGRRLAPGTPTGHGLLSIRERLVLLGGRLQAEDVHGGGTRVTLVVPRQSTEAADDPSAPVPRVDDAARVRVLIADDHRVVRAGLAELLADHPQLQVVGEAVDGVDAVAQARALRPDVVLMDVLMPRMDGIEATRRICEELPGVQVVGLSTQERTGRLHPIEQAGACGYFTKGDDETHLIARLLTVRGPDAPPRPRSVAGARVRSPRPSARRLHRPR